MDLLLQLDSSLVDEEASGKRGQEILEYKTEALETLNTCCQNSVHPVSLPVCGGAAWDRHCTVWTIVNRNKPVSVSHSTIDKNLPCIWHKDM